MIFDIVCLLILALGCLIGYFKGLFKMLSHLISFILAFIIAFSCSGELASITYSAVLQPTLANLIDDKIEEYGAKETVTELYGIVAGVQTQLGEFNLNETLENMGITGSSAGVSVTDSLTGALAGVGVNLDDVMASEELSGLKESYDNFAEFFSGLSPKVTNFVADKIDMTEFTQLAGNVLTTPDEVDDSDVSSALCNLLRLPIVSLITPFFFAIIFILCSIILSLVLGLIVKLLDKITLVEKLNHFAGMGIGAVCAVPFAVVAILCANIFITPASDLYQYVDGSFSLKLADSVVEHIDFDFSADDIPEYLSNLGKDLSSQVSGTSSVSESNSVG